MIHHKKALRFTCTGCAACCTGSNAYCVEASAVERERIRRALGVSRAWFRRRYLEPLGDGALGLRLEHGRCVFLQGKRCRIYALRPVQCRTYPWWPELLASTRSFNAEQGRCEGIGRGAIVPRAQIDAALRQQGVPASAKREPSRTGGRKKENR